MEGETSALEERAIETAQFQRQKENSLKKKKKRLWGYNERPNIHVTGVPEEEEKAGRVETALNKQTTTTNNGGKLLNFGKIYKPKDSRS